MLIYNFFHNGAQRLLVMAFYLQVVRITTHPYLYGRHCVDEIFLAVDGVGMATIDLTPYFVIDSDYFGARSAGR